MSVAVRNRIIIGAVFVVAASIIGYQMYLSLTPARHADHDHAIANLDAGGFLWVEVFGGGRRNLVGRPDKVLIMHFFDPRAAASPEEVQAARFVATVANDPDVDVLFVAQAPSWDGVEAWAEGAGLPTDRLFLDIDGKTGELFGVRRIPENLIYDPAGLLAFQSKGPMDWSSGLVSRIETAKRGVQEIQ